MPDKTNERIYIEKKCKEYNIDCNNLTDEQALEKLFKAHLEKTENRSNKSIFIEWKLAKDGIDYNTVLSMSCQEATEYLASIEKEKTMSVLMS